MRFNPNEHRGWSTDVRYLLTVGTAAAKAGEREEAVHYLEWVLRTESSEAERNEARYWLAQVHDRPETKRHYLEEILARNPGDARAHRQLAILNGDLDKDEIVDPEKISSAGAVVPREADTHRFLCPRCAARMVFAPDGHTLYCEHCGYGQTPPAGKEAVSEQDFIVAMATARGHSRPEAMQAFQCKGCAATFLLAPETISVTCPYCRATYSVERKEMRELIPPQGIIPFVIGEEQAQKLADNWLAHQKVAGRAPVNGVYLPVWTFDVGGAIGWRGHDLQYRQETKSWRPLSGSYPIFYDDFLVPACDTLPSDLARAALTRFDLAQVVNFERGYLAAWPAQTYEINVGDASLVARRRVMENKRRQVLAHLGGQVDQVRLSTAEMMVESYKLLLLPLWLARYSFAGRKYMIVVNGQTGAVGGEKRRGQGLPSLVEKAGQLLEKWLK